MAKGEPGHARLRQRSWRRNRDRRGADVGWLERLQAPDQQLEFVVRDVPGPVRERRRLQLAEPERQLDLVDSYRDQPSILLPFLGLVDHPLAVDGGARPQHDDAVRLFQLALDGAAESLAWHQLAIPEHVPTASFQCLF